MLGLANKQLLLFPKNTVLSILADEGELSEDWMTHCIEGMLLLSSHSFSFYLANPPAVIST